MTKKTYICIDLKSFYASVECVDRGLDPLTTNLVVADESRTEKTICLAVTPSLKSFGVTSRPRLFEVIQKVKEINANRQKENNNLKFISESYNLLELNDKRVKLTYIVAPPKMAHYIEVSSKIYEIYLKYISQEDIYVYSIDEVFMDVTRYLNTYQMSAYNLATTIIHNVFKETGITATAGIGTNMYLAKVAMDIVAKKIPADLNGVRIAELDEMTYRKELWNHVPLKDFWRIGPGYVKRLEKLGLYTMGDIAKCSVGPINSFYNENLLYKEFGVNAELLIDHAWGIEPVTIEDVKKYKPKSKSISTGQVLPCGYEYESGKLIVKEMVESLSLDLVEKEYLTKQLVLTIVYDNEGKLKDENKLKNVDPSLVEKLGAPSVHGSINLDDYTSSAKELMKAVVTLYRKLVNPILLVRRVSICANDLMKVSDYHKTTKLVQLSIFDNPDEVEQLEKTKRINREKERELQKTIISLKGKYGKNAVIKGMNLEEGGKTIERNQQIGGHKS